MNGIYNKHRVMKASGYTPSNAQYFVLRVDTDAYARDALLVYADLIADDNPDLSDDLYELVERYSDTPHTATLE